MTTTSPAQVLVGVDGTPASKRGLEYAATEAQRLGLALHLLHATPGERAAGPPLPIIPDGSLRAYGHELLAEAAVHVHKVAPDLPVVTSLVPGGAVATLVEAGKEAAMIVLGSERQSLAARIWTGDVVAGVAARASCPVVVVPPAWQAHQDFGRVVVGLESTEHCEHLLRAGLTRADERDAELVIVNAWKLESGYDDIVANRVDADEWGEHQTALIEPIVQELRTAHHDVPVRIEILHAQPAFALVHASAKADRLVISRPEHLGVFHHLGAVSRAVLRESHCPVEIVPPPT
jgi:nucleotide-binding universal stress UspA family protein